MMPTKNLPRYLGFARLIWTVALFGVLSFSSIAYAVDQSWSGPSESGMEQTSCLGFEDSWSGGAGTTLPVGAVTEALFADVTVAPQQRQLLLKLIVPMPNDVGPSRGRGPRVVQLKFHRILGSTEDSNAVVEATTRYLSTLFPATRYGQLIPARMSLPATVLSKDDQSFLSSPQLWPATGGDLPVGGEGGGAGGCPPPFDEAIKKAFEIILYSCGGTIPSIVCNCEEGSTACAKYIREDNSINLCLSNCQPNSTERLQSRIVHELMHAAQRFCSGPPTIDHETCDRNILEEFQAYLCGGACNSVLGCCKAQALSSVGSHLCPNNYWETVKRCLSLVQEDPSRFYNQGACCPNGAGAEPLHPCTDQFTGVGDKRAKKPDGICDEYQDCLPDRDRDNNGVCDWYQRCPGPQCNPDGPGSCWEVAGLQPLLIELAGQCGDFEGDSCDGTPSNRLRRCTSAKGTQQELVCCQDQAGCPKGSNGRCWRPQESCNYPSWCAWN